MLAYQTRYCPVPSGPQQNCRAVVLCNQNTILTAEVRTAVDDVRLYGVSSS